MKRVAAAALWLYSFWALGSLISMLIGVPDLLGPVLGLAAGVVVGVDPRRAIWRRSGGRPSAAQVRVTA